MEPLERVLTYAAESRLSRSSQVGLAVGASLPVCQFSGELDTFAGQRPSPDTTRASHARESCVRTHEAPQRELMYWETMREGSAKAPVHWAPSSYESVRCNYL